MDDVNQWRPGCLGVLGSAALWAQAPATLYVEELLAQAGVLNWRWLASPEELADESVRVALIPNGRLVRDNDVRTIRRFIERGGCLLALGRPGALEQLFPIRCQPPVREGWLVPGPAITERMTSACVVPLHVFDLVHLLANDEGEEPIAPLHFSAGTHYVNWPVSSVIELGAGRAMLIAADIAGSIVRIQQGLAIHHDGQPAPDGSAALDDEILKCDDSIMLDWTRDRQRPVDDLPPVFLQPQADLLRELLLAALRDLADHTRMPLITLDVWPRRLPAIGMISHDSDLNQADRAESQLAADRDADIAAVWHVMAGTGDEAVREYSPELLARIVASGHELALNYDAKTDHPACRWGQATLDAQLDRVRQKMRLVGINAAILSNRNHFCRWEGRLEFFRWLLAAGLRVDQTKGPTKTGCLGWPFGSCHPWRPIDDEVAPPYLMDLLEISFATHDIGGLTTPAALGRPIIDSAIARGGVVSLLYHPWRSNEPSLRASLIEHVSYGRSKGIEWWPARQIANWQFARRAVRLRGQRLQAGRLLLELDAPRALETATFRAGIANSQAVAVSGQCEVGIGIGRLA